MSSFPYFGFGSFFLDGLGISCTFNYLDRSLKNHIFVYTIISIGFVSKFYSINILQTIKLKFKRIQNSRLLRNELICKLNIFYLYYYLLCLNLLECYLVSLQNFICFTFFKCYLGKHVY